MVSLVESFDISEELLKNLVDSTGRITHYAAVQIEPLPTGQTQLEDLTLPEDQIQPEGQPEEPPEEPPEDQLHCKVVVCRRFQPGLLAVE